jgi:hypothetical protein
MLGSKILDVAIGLIFVYIIVSIICTAVREGIETWLKTRAAYLEHGIRVLLQDGTGEKLAKDLYEHPLIDGLFMGKYKPGSTNTTDRPVHGGNLPSYIPSKSFASALLDLAARGPVKEGSVDRYGPPISLDAIRRNVTRTIPGNTKVQRIILHAVDTAEGDLDKAQKAIEDWYDSSMDRVSGWYKRSTQYILLCIGLVVAVGMNIDSVAVVDQLYRSDAQREAVVAAATRAAERYNAANSTTTTTDTTGTTAPAKPVPGAPSGAAPPTTTPATTGTATAGGTTTAAADDKKKKNEAAAQALGGKGTPYDDAKAALADLHLPIGWDKASLYFHCPPKGKFLHDAVYPWLGWILTAIAASLGAPFWFDILNKVMVIRSTVKPHEKSPEESSEDRQKPAGTTVVVNPGGGPPQPPGGGGGGGNGNPTPDPDADGCDVLQSGAFDLADDSQLPTPEGGVA